MQKLNLPSYSFTISEQETGSYIFDIIRKKYVKLDPEEWVRQHFIHYLIQELHYSKTLISCESGLKYNSLLKRSDILVYDQHLSPYLLVECKAPAVSLNQQTLIQASMYNKTIKAPHIAITNGLQHFAFKIDVESGKSEQLNSFPPSA